MKDYKVMAFRSGQLWELHVDGVGVTQTRSVSQAEAMVRDYLYVMEAEEPDSIEIFWKLGEEIDSRVVKVRLALEDAAERQRAAAAAQRALAVELRSRGFINREIAAVLGVTEQRASQLLPPLRSRKSLLAGSIVSFSVRIMSQLSSRDTHVKEAHGFHQRIRALRKETL